MAQPPPRALKGRGATFNPENRFRRDSHEAADDGWLAPACDEADEAPVLHTTVAIQRSRTIIARNESPDIPFDRSINPYQGCEHGCIYCYARPSHAYLDLSPGLDFETKLFAKPDAAALLRQELAKPGYRCQPMALGTNTDPYQPIEREWRITRQIIEVLAECEHPITITTKGVLIERDLDLLAAMAEKKLVHVQVSIAMLDKDLARKLDPRAPSPQRRLEMIRSIASSGVPVGVNVAPVIPQLTDKDLEAVLESAAAHGARSAMWVMLRLPWEVKDLFRDWLAQHYPMRAHHVMSLVRQSRGGRDNDPGFGSRMRGQGQFADLIQRRFDIACARLGLNVGREFALDTTLFRSPKASVGQLDLF